MNKPANLSLIQDILWPLTQRICLDDCAKDALVHMPPRGVLFDKEHALAADSLVEGGYLTTMGPLYFCTRKGWDVLGDTIWRKA